MRIQWDDESQAWEVVDGSGTVWGMFTQYEQAEQLIEKLDRSTGWM